MLDLSQETEALARRLAAAQRVSIDEAIRQALEERARSAGLTDADKDRQAWRIEEIPDEYIDLVRKAEAPEKSKGFNEEVPPGWTGR